MPISLKLFKTDGEFLTPIVADWYHIPVDTLDKYKSDGRHEWFPHLAEKDWFTQEMFWELLEFTKDKFPAFNPDKAIFQAGYQYGIGEGIELEKAFGSKTKES